MFFFFFFLEIAKILIIPYAIVDLDGNVQQSWSIETDILNDGKNIVPNIIDSIKHRLDLYQMTPDQFLGIGMGSPGKVDLINGTVKNAFNLNWHRTQQIKEPIEKRLIGNMYNASSEIKTGDNVIHTVFGEGIVVNVSGGIATIAFKNGIGIKSIAANHKYLTRK